MPTGSDAVWWWRMEPGKRVHPRKTGWECVKVYEDAPPRNKWCEKIEGAPNWPKMAIKTMLLWEHVYDLLCYSCNKSLKCCSREIEKNISGVYCGCVCVSSVVVCIVCLYILCIMLITVVSIFHFIILMLYTYPVAQLHCLCCSCKTQWKKCSEETQTLRTGCSKAEPKI